MNPVFEIWKGYQQISLADTVKQLKIYNLF